jgi:peptidoglycan-associated lipoprotein
MHTTSIPLVALLLVALALAGCPKQIPQPEIDAAEQALANLAKLKDCAPETAQAAETSMERAKALMKEERYEEAKTAFIAAKQLAEKARKECDEKEKSDAKEAKRLAAEQAALEAARAIEKPSDAQKGPGEMVTVYFGFNNSALTDETREALTHNAKYLRHHEAARIQIEGHCDERGSTEYNLSLGERRALSVKKFLSKLGIDPDRLEIISYGEERVDDPGVTDEAHAKNRRTEFMKLK